MNGIYALHRTLHPRGLRAKVQARTVSLWPLSPRLCKSPLKGGGARWRAPGDVRYADETSPWRYRAIPLQRGNKFSSSCLTAHRHGRLLIPSPIAVLVPFHLGHMQSNNSFGVTAQQGPFNLFRYQSRHRYRHRFLRRHQRCGSPN